MAEQLGDLRKLQCQVGFHDALHDPDNGWLSVESGSLLGERPVSPESPVGSAGANRVNRAVAGGTPPLVSRGGGFGDCDQ